MTGANKILVIRFSAMGDVAMTAPVLKEFVQNYPDAELLMLSRSLFEPFFNDINNLHFYPFDPKQKHKGFWGLIKLFIALRQQKITSVADLHNNLRSKILRLLFFFSGIKTAALDKGRKEKKELTRKQEKTIQPLKLTVVRYADVFGILGFPFTLKNALTANIPSLLDQDTFPFIALTKTGKWIGISPFAQHQQKVYPLHKMETVISQLAALDYQLFVFGGSDEEELIAKEWEAKHRNVTSVVKKVRLNEELKLISNLDLMLSMDSAGMHLASLCNVPVVSVWGATHSYAGFLGYGQSIADAVQTDLYCRPCSVYGNVPCYRGDFACMNNLPESIVIDRILNKLNNG